MTCGELGDSQFQNFDKEENMNNESVKYFVLFQVFGVSAVGFADAGLYYFAGVLAMNCLYWMLRAVQPEQPKAKAAEDPKK